MGSRITRIARRYCSTRLTSSNKPLLLALVLGLALSGVARPVGAQSSDAGAAPDSEAAHTTAATDPNAEAAATPPAAEAAPNNSGFPKALSPQQRLPENLQGWLRERNRRHPAVAERPPTAPLNVAPPAAPSEEQAVAGYKRRLRSFDEHGVTVLSNRHAVPAIPEPTPEATPEAVAATAAIAVAAAVPAPRVEEDPEPESSRVTETRSLRAKQKAKASLPEPGLGWPAYAVPIAAIGLALIWLRRRRQAE